MRVKMLWEKNTWDLVVNSQGVLDYFNMWINQVIVTPAVPSSAYVQEKVIEDLGIKGLMAETLDFTWIIDWIYVFFDEPEIFSALSKEISKRTLSILDKKKYL